MSQKNPILVKYKKLEILANPGTIQAYRNKKLPLSKVLVSETIFSDSKKGRQAGEADLNSTFGEFNLESEAEMIEYMLQHGDFQMTTKERQELIDRHRNKVIEYFVKNYVNPSTLVSHPPQRIEQTLQKIKARLDYTVSFDKQVKEIHKKMLGVLPLKPVSN